MKLELEGPVVNMCCATGFIVIKDVDRSNKLFYLDNWR